MKTLMDDRILYGKLRELYRDVDTFDKFYNGNKVLFYVPHRKQKAFHGEDDKYVRFVRGGNRSGKTTCGTTESLAHSYGYRPWLAPEDPNYTVRLANGRPIPVPNKGRVIADTFESSIAQTIWPKFEEWLPEGSVKEIRRNQHGVPIRVTLVNSSIIYFMSYDQKPKVFEGTDHHWAWFDEPPPQNVYNAVRRGLIDHSGHCWLTMTPIAEPWIAAAIHSKANVPGSGIAGYNMSIWDNCTKNGGTLGETDILSYLDSLDPDEREAREYGEFLHLTGRVFKKWVPESPYWIPEGDIPLQWPRVCVIDPHPRKPIAVLWAAFSPDNIIYIYRCLFDSGLETVHDVCEEIKRLEGWREVDVDNWATEGYHTRPSHFVRSDRSEFICTRIIDTSANEPERTSGDTVSKQFAIAKLPCVDARKRNKSAGLNAIKEALNIRNDWGKPQLIVFDNCEAVKQNFENYVWEQWGTSRLQGLKGEKQETVKNHDDFIDCIRYLYQMRLSYRTLVSTMRTMQRVSSREEDLEPVFGRSLGRHAGLQRLERNRGRRKTNRARSWHRT